ncbi:arginase family protein, partial [Streptomyces sp. NPDC102365]|uniref:arginase family protein n=1 Tax=Streptomyces sp. NPDC102365 TaxID=3366162 RepID=UPI0038162346
MRNLVVLDAPSNLGLRPPAPGTVPGCYKLAGALREQRIVQRLNALEGGVVVPPRYDRGDWQEGDGVFNAAALAAYTRTLADRIERHVRAGELPVVLGGDCSIQLGASLALRRVGRYGLAAVDASHDFRHPGNSDRIGGGGGGGGGGGPPPPPPPPPSPPTTPPCAGALTAGRPGRGGPRACRVTGCVVPRNTPDARWAVC